MESQPQNPEFRNNPENFLVKLDCDSIFPLQPSFECASSDGSGKSTHLRRLARAFTAHICNKYRNLMSWSFYMFACLC